MSEQKFSFYDADALQERLCAGIRGQASEVVFVVGSGLTTPATPGASGVPGVEGVIELIREAFLDSERNKLDEAIRQAHNKYQEAFRFLLGRRGPKAANGIIKRAVAAARRPLVSIEGKPTYEITASTSDDSCRGFDNDFGGWMLTPGVDGLGRLIAMPQSPFARMVVTTNFDPLIGAAIGAHGGSSFRSFLHRDGSLNQTDGPGTHVVHLHGYWYGSDTLHTPQQLLQDRPQLKASLAHLLRGHIIVVMAYGGWEDAFTQAMMSVVLDDSSFPEIIWCFYEAHPLLTSEFETMLRPGLSRGRVTLYSGINVHTFLPRLADAWNAPASIIQPATLQISSTVIVEQTDVTPTQDLSSAYQGPLLDSIVREDNPPVVEFLVGRDANLQTLCTTSFRVAFVTGLGGQGKSALAAKYFSNQEVGGIFRLRIWRDCRERSARFEDQIATIIEALGAGKVSAGELAKQPMEDLADLFVQLTQQAPILVVFDNVDHYVDLERRTLVGPPGAFVDRFLALNTESRLVFTCRPPIRTDLPLLLAHHLEGLDLLSTVQLFSLRRAHSSLESIERAHIATNGHTFWLDLLAAQVAKRAPDVQLDDLLQSISEGTGEIPDATLRSIWNSLRSREQVVLQALAESLRPTSLLELADYVRREINFKTVNKAIGLLRDLNLVVLKVHAGEADTFELHPLIRAFIQQTFPRTQRVPFILAILSNYKAWLAPYLPQLETTAGPEAVHRALEAAELCINADQSQEALERLVAVLRAVRRREPPSEFVRIAQRLFANSDLSKLQQHQDFERLYDGFVILLANLGKIGAATEALTAYEVTLQGKDARYIHYCDMQCYLHWVSREFSTAIRWGLEGEDLRSTGVDTKFSSAHNLALAQRDSGAIDSALKYFLRNTSIDDAANPQKVDVDLGGAFYGNVGRCLHLMGQAEPAIACYRKSAYLIQEDKSELLENHAYIRQWVGELLLARSSPVFARECLDAAIVKWSIVSPPRAKRLREFIHATSDDAAPLADPARAEAHFRAWIHELG